jgi:hypothetical protein
MNILKILLPQAPAIFAASLLITAAALLAQDQSTSPTASPVVTTSPVAAPAGSPSDAEMMKQMMDLAKLNENHKLLQDLAGTWNYTVKFWMNPDSNAPPQESKGVAVRKPIMGGRYFTLDVTGRMKVPGADGKLKDFEFKGTSIEGYDNVKQKFVGTWADNMGTGIIMSEGTYDPATKTFTYNTEMEPVPGMKTKVRETMKIDDKDHHTFEWYEDRGGQEVKTMEINYTRKKS